MRVKQLTESCLLLLLIGQNISFSVDSKNKFFQLMDTGVGGQAGLSAPKHVRLAPDTDPGSVLGHSVVENHARETLMRRETAMKKLFVVNNATISGMTGHDSISDITDII